MLTDLRFALRQMLKSPAFTVTAIVTLALGIGANTAIFSVVNAVLRHPAGVDHPERIAVMHVRYTQFTLDVPNVSVPTFAKAAAMSDEVEAAAIEQGASFNIERDGQAENIPAAMVSSGWFNVYAARPIVGRTFTAEEDQPGAGPVVVLSYGMWQRVFGGRQDVAGQTLLLGQKPYRVVGVMRSDFAWPRKADVWVPIALAPAAFNPNNLFNEQYYATARLREGVPVEKFSASLASAMWATLQASERGTAFAKSSGWSVYATPLTDFAAGPLRTPLYVLCGVVALVLLDRRSQRGRTAAGARFSTEPGVCDSHRAGSQRQPHDAADAGGDDAAGRRGGGGRRDRGASDWNAAAAPGAARSGARICGAHRSGGAWIYRWPLRFWQR